MKPRSKKTLILIVIIVVATVTIAYKSISAHYSEKFRKQAIVQVEEIADQVATIKIDGASSGNTARYCYYSGSGGWVGPPTIQCINEVKFKIDTPELRLSSDNPGIAISKIRTLSEKIDDVLIAYGYERTGSDGNNDKYLSASYDDFNNRINSGINEYTDKHDKAWCSLNASSTESTASSSMILVEFTCAAQNKNVALYPMQSN